MNAPISNMSEITVALSFISAEDRDTWLRMAMALKSELGEAGFEIWNGWSQTASNYNAKAAKSVWKGVKAAGGITIATLFHEARADGWTPTTLYTPPTPEERARIDAERKAAGIESERIEAEQRAQAKAKAERLWKKAGLVRADQPYVFAKAIKPHGAKQLRDMLVIPLRCKGELVNLQFIGKDGTKRFSTGGQVSGTSTVLGSIKDAPTALMCEGWATGCTLHEATGLSVIVCFNAHNLVTVAKNVANVFEGRVLVCGDNDTGTKGNPGQTAAMKAANCLVGGRFILPDFTSDQIERHTQQHGKTPTDFNDLHQLEGLNAVREQITAAMVGTTDKLPPRLQEPENFSDIEKNCGATGADNPQPSNGAGSTEAAGRPNGENQSGAIGADAGLPAGFLLKMTGENAGTYFRDPTGEKPPFRFSAPLRVLAQTRDSEGKGWGRLVEFFDAEGRHHQFAIPASMTCGDGLELVRMLVDSGLVIVPGRTNQQKMASYIMAARGNGFVRCTNRTGWHGDAFVLPDEVIAAPGAERVFLQAERNDSLGMTQAGTPDEWRDNVSALASGNSRLLFAISLAFAAPLASLAGQAGGFHLVGTSSTGKSTAQLLASSAWGNPELFKQSWKATGNAVEGICAARNDLPLVLDELAEIDGKYAGEVAYMIANGQGKGRSTRDGGARTRRRWNAWFLSSGEIPLAQHMAEAGKQIRGGQEVRMVNIEADAGQGFGIFDALTGGEATGAAMSDRVKAESARYYGTAGRAFLRLAVEQRRELTNVVKEARAQFIQNADLPTSEGQVSRVVGMFSLVAVAGELATSWGITGWQQGEAWDAALRLFSEWLAARGGCVNSEAARGVAAVREFLELHGESRFTPWDADEEARQRTINRVGFRKLEDDGQWFYVLLEGYRNHVCKGFDPKLITRALAEKGALQASKEKTRSGDPRYDGKQPMPGMGRPRCYLITPAIWED